MPGAAWDLALTPGATSPPLSFSQPTSPAPSSPHRYVLVFRGTLGLEPDAVAGQLVTLTTHTLRVTKSGGGTGSVASTPPGITCGGDCTEDYCTTRR